MWEFFTMNGDGFTSFVAQNCITKRAVQSALTEFMKLQ